MKFIFYIIFSLFYFNLSSAVKSNDDSKIVQIHQVYYSYDFYNNDNNCSKCEPTRILASSSNENSTASSNTMEDFINVAKMRFSLATSDFTQKFLYYELHRQKGVSLVVTPLSVLFLLTQLALYAEDPAYTELTKLVNLNNRDEIRALMPYLQVFIENQTALSYYTAQKVYVNDPYKLKYSFIQDSILLFRADAENLDFSDPFQADADINRWVTARSNYTLANIVTPEMFNPLSNIFLIQAVFFKGFWETKFNPNNTALRDFKTNSSNTVQILTMNARTQVLHARNAMLDAELIEIPYVGDFAFVVVLPNTADGLNKLLDKLYDYRVLNDLIDTSVNKTVDLYLPKFTIDTTVNLSTALKTLNITSIFNETASGLSGLLKKPENIYVSDGVLRTRFEISEDGGNAQLTNCTTYGATADGTGSSAIVLKANRPFIFFVKLKTGPKCPLFTGVFLGK